MDEVIVLKQEDFLNVIKNYCSKYNWPIPKNNIIIKIINSNKFVEAHILYEIYSKGTLRKQHIIIDKKWMKVFLEETIQSKIKNDFIVETTTDSDFSDLIIIKKKFKIFNRFSY